MRRVSRFNAVVTSRMSKVSVAVATLMTAALIVFGGLSTVGAQATGTYQCGTYGGGNYNQTDCTDPAPAQTQQPATTSPSSGSTPQSSSSSASSASGGSSSTGTATAATPLLLNDYSEYTASTGKGLDLKQGDVLNFNLKGEKHTITVKTITSSSIVLTVASTPTDVTVPFNQTVSYDVDKDGSPDIEFMFAKYSGTDNTANATFHAVSADTAATPAPITSNTGTSSAGGTTAPAATTGSANFAWLFIIPIIIGIGLLIWAIIAAKRRKAAANNGNVGGTNFQF